MTITDPALAIATMEDSDQPDLLAPARPVEAAARNAMARAAVWT